MADTPISFPILSIVLYYVLAIYPHAHALLLASKGNLRRHDNRNPKASGLQESIKKRLTPREFARWERAESCHRNHLENMSLFVASIFAGLLAEQKVPGRQDEVGLQAFCVGWLFIRVVYTVNYIATDTQGWSYVRTLLYYVGSGWAFRVLWKAAVVLGN